MIRALIFLLLVTLVALAAVPFVAEPGNVRIEGWDWRVDTSVGVLLLAVVLLAAAAAAAYRFWRTLRVAPRALVEAGRGHRRNRGSRALAQAMAAVAAGDADEAVRLARRADNLLDDPGLTLPLMAQAARLSGDQAAAKRCYEAMAANRSTAFVGISGLLGLARQAGDTGEALRLARQAHGLRADAPWVLDNLFQLQVRAGHWDEALATLGRAVKRKVIGADRGMCHRAALLVERGAERERAGDAAGALADALKAAELAPALAPAAATALRLLAASGKERRAMKLVQRIWAAHPQPQLASHYLAIWPDDSPPARARRAAELAAPNPDHPESRLMMAEAAMKAEQWDQARGHLRNALAEAQVPSARYCRLMAELERLQRGNLAAAQYWLEQAAVAPPAPAWVCGECGATADDWTSICGHCDAFDSIAWRLPPRIMPPEGPRPEADRPGGGEPRVDPIPPLPAPRPPAMPAAAIESAGAADDDPKAAGGAG